MIPANETPRHPHVEDYADIEAAWGDEPREPFAFDSLAVAATEYVAAEVRVEPFWKALLGIVGIFVTAFGFCAWAAFGQTMADFHRVCPAGTAQSDLCERLFSQITGTQFPHPDEEMRTKGCVMLTDRVLTSNPPQHEWLCPQN